MNLVKDILKAIALTTVIYCLYQLSLLINQSSRFVGKLELDETLAVAAIQKDHASVATSLKQHDEDIFRLSQVVGRTVVDFQRSTNSQKTYWDTNSQAFGMLLTDADSTVLSLNDSSRKFQDDLDVATWSLDGALNSIPPVTEQARQDLFTFNMQMNNPDLNGILAEAHGTMKDVRRKADSLVAPPTKLDAVKDWLMFGARMGYYLKP